MPKRENGSVRDQRFGFAEQPRVVVRFRDSVELPYERGAEEVVEARRIGPWRKLQERFGELRLEPMITSLEPQKIEALLEQAQRMDQSYRPAKFTAFYWVDAPSEVDFDDLAAELAKWPAVETAYVDRPGPDPVVNAANDPRSTNQGYLNAAPDGIDALYAWGFAGGDGAGQRVVDLERGWTLNHEDLVAHGVTQLHGVLLDSSRSHGTAVLGEICAVDNAIGCVGITPNVADVAVTSYNGSNRPDAILAALPSMDFGDVLIIEAQVVAVGAILGPIEVLDADYEALRLATALGIIVVEAGGNGTDNGSAPPLNLDTFTNGAGQRILDPSSADFRDSGAIIVSAATSTAPHTRLAYGPHGQRIDCYAWAENIDTLSSSTGGSTTMYTTGFGGTSGASPIITGAALAVQGIMEAAHGFRLGPRQMREVLSNPATGTAPAATETTAIGVMPNLRAIIDATLALAPDLYLRDFVGDLGEPHAGPVSSSPDLIVVPAPGPANPQTAYGAGSGTEGSASLTVPLTIGSDHVVYARVLNQGGSAATATVDVYWSPPATLVTPDLWTLIGTITVPNVPTGEQLTVGPALSWPAGSLPAAGHYCLVGIVGSAQDPAPGPADFLNWNNFVTFIRNNNNVTWRNFDVVTAGPSTDPTVPKGFQAFPFLIVGAPDRARPMQLDLVSRLPKESRVLLEVPLTLLDAFREWQGNYDVDKKRQVALLPVAAWGRRPIATMYLPAKSRYETRLLVHLGPSRAGAAHDVAVRQTWKDIEVGRITWRLVTARTGRKIGDDDVIHLERPATPPRRSPRSKVGSPG